MKLIYLFLIFVCIDCRSKDIYWMPKEYVQYGYSDGYYFKAVHLPILSVKINEKGVFLLAEGREEYLQAVITTTDSFAYKICNLSNILTKLPFEDIDLNQPNIKFFQLDKLLFFIWDNNGKTDTTEFINSIDDYTFDSYFSYINKSVFKGFYKLDMNDSVIEFKLNGKILNSSIWFRYLIRTVYSYSIVDKTFLGNNTAFLIKLNCKKLPTVSYVAIRKNVHDWQLYSYKYVNGVHKLLEKKLYLEYRHQYN